MSSSSVPSPPQLAAEQALKTESRYLAGVRANLENAKGVQLRGSIWQTAEDDEGDALRALMASRRMYDRDLLRRLPHNRRVVIRGFERRMLFWRKATGTAVATVLSPVEQLLDGSTPPRPIDLNEVLDHLRHIAPDPKVRQVIGLCATSGFTEEARNARFELPNTLVVLVEPTAAGGWRITAGDDVPEFVRRLFDPEDSAQKTERVRRAVEERSTDLLTGGLSAEALASQMELPAEVVTQAFAQLAKDDPELRVSVQDGDRLLYRGAPVGGREKSVMSFVDKIRELFSSRGDEVGKINMLSERRAALAQRRDRMYEDIGKLEQKEADLVQQGRENKSLVVRRRLAAQVAQLRKDITRLNTTANMLNQQINIISTDIHNLTLIQQGQMAALPSTEDLTENAVRAEEMLETLKADADLVAGLETGMGEVLTSDDERAILAEFDGPETAAPPAAAKTPPAAGRTPAGPVAERPPTPEGSSRRATPDRPQTTDPEAS